MDLLANDVKIQYVIYFTNWLLSFNDLNMMVAVCGVKLM
jgi:hypothetical protein